MLSKYYKLSLFLFHRTDLMFDFSVSVSSFRRVLMFTLKGSTVKILENFDHYNEDKRIPKRLELTQ